MSWGFKLEDELGLVHTISILNTSSLSLAFPGTLEPAVCHFGWFYIPYRSWTFHPTME